MKQIFITLFVSLGFCLNASAASLTTQDDANRTADEQNRGGGAPDLTVARNCENDCRTLNTNVDRNAFASAVKQASGSSTTVPQTGSTRGKSE